MDFKTQLIAKIEEAATAIPDLESLTIVGSHGDPQKALENVNDFDTLFLLKKLDAGSYLQIRKAMDSLAATLTNPEVKVWAEYRIGPVKATYDTGEDMGVMLHILVFDLESFAEYQKISPFIALDWLKFRALSGKDLSDIYTFDFPTKENLLHSSRASFEYYEKMLDDKVYILLDVGVEEDALKMIRNEYPYPKAQWGELYADILKKVILNTDIVYSKVNRSWSDDELLQKFVEIFPEFTSDLGQIKEIMGLKKRVRSGEDLSAVVEEYEKSLRALLFRIKEAIEKN